MNKKGSRKSTGGKEKEAATVSAEGTIMVGCSYPIPNSY